MDVPPVPSIPSGRFDGNDNHLRRTQSFSSNDSQTAADFINNQLQLEADAREALPYKFDSCTRELGPLRQLLFACLTCNPPPVKIDDKYSPAGVCYSCSVQCHGDHQLVELFNKRNFVCDCGTTRLPEASPCSLRINPATNLPGGVHSEPPDMNNKYNHNFRNRFCGCECDYDPHQQKGTMFQCLGLGSVEDGGCGEDWYHPGCLVGLGPNWYDKQTATKKQTDSPLQTITETVSDAAALEQQAGSQTHIIGNNEEGVDEDEIPSPPGFPHEDDFEGFICYKCVDANPWIKRYAGSPGFLEPVFKRSAAPSPEAHPITDVNTAEDIFSTAVLSNKVGGGTNEKTPETNIAQVDSKTADGIFADPVMSEKRELNTKEVRPSNYPDPTDAKSADEIFAPLVPSKKRKVDDDIEETNSSKRVKDVADLNSKSISTSTTGTLDKTATLESECKYEALPAAPEGTISLFFKSDFRDHLCRCSNCFPQLSIHAQLLEEEDTYEPPVSESGDDGGDSTVGGGSIYDRGESALKNMDRVRAIEGVMAYNHMKEKLTPFFAEFAESGKAIGAEDIKAYFAKLRGDETNAKDVGEAEAADSGNREEQSGY